MIQPTLFFQTNPSQIVAGNVIHPCGLGEKMWRQMFVAGDYIAFMVEAAQLTADLMIIIKSCRIQ